MGVHNEHPGICFFEVLDNDFDEDFLSARLFTRIRNQDPIPIRVVLVSMLIPDLIPGFDLAAGPDDLSKHSLQAAWSQAFHPRVIEEPLRGCVFPIDVSREAAAPDCLSNQILSRTVRHRQMLGPTLTCVKLNLQTIAWNLIRLLQALDPELLLETVERLWEQPDSFQRRANLLVYGILHFLQ